jgi:hypothetical protein
MANPNRLEGQILDLFRQKLRKVEKNSDTILNFNSSMDRSFDTSELENFHQNKWKWVINKKIKKLAIKLDLSSHCGKFWLWQTFSSITFDRELRLWWLFLALSVAAFLWLDFVSGKWNMSYWRRLTCFEKYGYWRFFGGSTDTS